MSYCKSIEKRYAPLLLDRGDAFDAFYTVDGIECSLPIYKKYYPTLELAERFFNVQLIGHARVWPVEQ